MIITIGREFGSCGHKIGELVAQKLGIPYYDKEIITLAAKKSGYEEEVFDSIDEKQSTSLLFSIAMGLFPYASKMENFESGNLSDKLFGVQRTVIEELAKKGDCVMIGRCCNYILKDRKDLLSVFITMPIEKRIESLAKKENMPENKAKEYIEKMDKSRASYFNYYTGEKWGRRETYDLIINADVLGVEGTAEFIKELAQAKSKQE